MANTSSRALRLLALLQARRHWSGPTLADRLVVSERTLRRDVDRLRELGYPVEAHRGTDGGYRLAAGAAMPPLMVDDDEAVALVVGLQAATQGAVAGVAESSVRALAKLLPVLPARVRRRVEALRSMTEPATWSPPGASIDPEALTTIAQACQATERLRFAYTAADGALSERHVEPLRLVALGRRWYLAAYDLTRQDWRSFRLDRLAAPQATGVRFRPRELPAADAAAFVRASIENQPGTYAIDALVHAPAETVTAQIGRCATIEAVSHGCCRLTMTTDSLDWPAMALGTIAAEFEVIAPPELKVQLADWSQRFHHASTAPPQQTAEHISIAPQPTVPGHPESPQSIPLSESVHAQPQSQPAILFCQTRKLAAGYPVLARVLGMTDNGARGVGKVWWAGPTPTCPRCLCAISRQEGWWRCIWCGYCEPIDDEPPQGGELDPPLGTGPDTVARQQ
jgi:predicted DNA-binding transcriptional regulator YafY